MPSLRHALTIAALGGSLAVPMAVATPASAEKVTPTPTTAPAAQIQLGPEAAREARRTAAVPTPRINWQPCDRGQCATVDLPLDYDNPRGATISVALTRIPARKPDKRVGSLFLNPGGPGASGTDFPQRAQAWLGQDVLDRFDLIGFDPRGTHRSTRTHCFRTPARLDKVTGTLVGMGFPLTRSEEREFTKASSELARACSGTGRTIASSISTAEVARDLEVLRRAVGDERLTYLGFSYGTYLGQVYANMFPDRVRAIAIDGVVDPRQWVGNPATAQLPMSWRMGSATGSEQALDELLQRCAAAGEKCPLTDPRATLDRVAQKLRTAPLSIPNEGGEPDVLTYQGFVTTLLFALYDPQVAQSIPEMIAVIDALQTPPTTGPRSADNAENLGLAWSRAARRVAVQTAEYDNTVEQVPSIMCSDSYNPRSAVSWRKLSPMADAQAPLFGRHWLWGSASCANNAWKLHDEDAWRGPFDSRTANPLLVVGNLHDPATNYAAARNVSRLLPGARLVTSNNWGHTAYGVSACATRTVDSYLLGGQLPAGDVTCTDGAQPFEG